MSTFTQLTPHPHAAKDKHDVIDWQHLPRGECDMNYRLAPSSTSSLSELLFVWLAVSVGAFMLFLSGSLLQQFSVTVFGGFPRLIVIALLFGGIALLRDRTPKGFQRCLETAAGVFVVGALMLVAAGALTQPQRIATLLVAAMLGLAWIADAVATTNAWWCTAHPRVKRATMTAYREAWRNRWLAEPPRFEQPLGADQRLAARRTPIAGELDRYRLGVVWLFCALFGGATVGLLTARLLSTPLIAVPVVVQTTVALVVTALVRFADMPPVLVRRIIAALVRHRCYGSENRQPPWVLHLPGEPAWKRSLQVSVVLGVIAFLAVSAVARETFPPEAGLLLPLVIVFGAALVTPVWMFCGIAIVAGRVILAHDEALDCPGAFEQDPKRSDWDGYVARLHESRNPLERRSIWNGCHLMDGYPILVDRSLYFEHVHVVGSSGSGKTALSLSSDLTQLIRNNTGADAAGGIVVIDCKGDPALLHTAREEAAAAGRSFKWFTNQPNRETYAFNPLLNLRDVDLSLSETIGVIAQSLNLYHGEGYGRGFFGAASRALLQAAYRTSFTFGGIGSARPPIDSFAELEEALKDCCDDPREYQAAKQLLDVVSSLTQFEQLNLVPGRLADSPALEHAIHMPSVIRHREVVYFYLVSAMDLSSVGHLARLVLYSTLAAAIEYRGQTGRPAGVHVIADEAQCLISKNVAPLLEQARSYGVGCVLAHQNMSQLNQEGGADMRELVLANTVVKRYHSARDPESQKYLAAVSGRSAYYDLDWDQLKRRAIGRGQIDSRYACNGPDGTMRVGVSQRVGDRVEIEEIADMNRRLNQSFMLIERNEALTQYNGGFLMDSDWPVDHGTFKRRDEAPWPSQPDETYAGGNESPLLRPTTHPQVDIAADPTELDERMRRVQKRLLGEFDADDSAAGADVPKAPETDPKERS